MKPRTFNFLRLLLILFTIWPFCNAAAQSPVSIGGRTFQLAISSGVFPFANSGAYRFLPSATDGSYAIVPIFGALSSSSGTHTYMKTGANTAQLAFTDSIAGFLTANCTFTTASSGTYSLTGISFPGSSQSGTFFLYSGTSPVSIAGYTFTVTVTSGTSPYASSGSYQFLPAASGNTYSIIGLSGFPNSTGNYSYTQNSTMTGIISFNDSITGTGLSSQLSFDTATSGTVLLRQSGNNGYQTAIFAMVSTVRPSISVNPQNQFAAVGSRVSFLVSANGPGTLTYQWRKNTFNISGATGESYNISSAETTDTGTYDVVVSNAGGSTTSAAATLTVGIPPSISVQPLNQEVTVGQNASFIVTATGTPPLNYQWRKDGVSLTGATGDSLTLNSVWPNQAGNYAVVITNAYGATTSSVAVLIVNAASSSTVVAWGFDGDGQTTVPSGLGRVTAIAAGAYHTVALSSDGMVAAWGYNRYQQISVPVGLGEVTAIAAGVYHTIALQRTGTVVGWGYNGDGETTVPVGLSGITAIAAGAYHTLALKTNGTVVAWGYNGYLQTTIPAGLSGVTAIAAGWYHSVALKSDGSVLAWGLNSSGQTTVPAGLTGVAAIAGGEYHTVALKADGTVVAWGYNNFGQTTVPAGLGGVTAIAAGWYHTVALKGDGTIVAWGANQAGQTTIPAGLSNVTAIAAGGFHTVALVRTGRSAGPRITTTTTSSTLTLIWPVVESGYRVESALSLSIPTAWSYESGSFLTNSGFISIVLPLTGAQKFYRLTKP